MKTKILTLVLSLALAACAIPVTQSEIQQAKFTPQPKQTEIDKEVNAFLKMKISNPEAAKKECSPPRKAWARDLSYKPANFGWLVVCDVNTKDGQGNFGPLNAYMFLFTTSGVMTYDSSSFVNINNNVQFLDLIGK
ncbi:hypothetical protein [Polynucleobacter brandtiae]|uniref:Lipoprotein n=1 Tax=Polynucleobacter brandtiae TaxID=1938816 RepID=A0A2M8VZY1_9BURK|nr:hypothetical protein [Polynucleobacter brandtiae]PJI83394.1 hypothetical protein B0G85_0792 [Polynucleobacter brandtiae]